MDRTADEVIEDMYPLSPLQRGLLFHLLRDPGSAEYISQVTVRQHGTGPAAIRLAWQTLAERHPVLRTGLLWESVEEPVQVVYRWAELPITVCDLRSAAEPEQDRRVAEFLLADRAAGFQPDEIPLARLTLLQLADDVVQVVWTHHGILLDGWSSGLLFSDLARIEAAMAAGTTPPPLASPPFRDYIGHILDRDVQADTEHWRVVLAGVAATTPLPLAAPRGDGGGDESACHEVSLPAAESDRVRAAIRELKIPFGVLAQGAWALTLSRYTSMDDVVFGLVVSGRTADLPGITEVVGMLTNTVPVRVPVRPDRTVGTWLGELAERHAATLAHEHTPLTEAQHHSAVPGGRPLFETVLVVQNFPLPSGDGDGGGTRITHAEAFESVHYPIVLFLIPGEQIVVRVAYRRGVVDERSARLVADCVRAALIGLTDVGRPLDAVPVFAAQRSALTVPSDGRKHDWTGAQTVPERFAEVVKSAPDATAVAGDGETLTYHELDRRAGRLADALGHAGAATEGTVGVLLERSAESVVAMLGVLQAGAGYVPVDPGYPAARIAHLLVDSACGYIVTNSALRRLLPAELTARVPVICLDDLPSVPPRTRPRLLPDNLAYVIYTSGSTGAPKGVMVSHRALLNTLRWMTDEFRLRAGHVVAHKVPVGFTDAIFEVLWPLCSGAAVAIMDSLAVRDPDAFAAKLNEHHVTHSQMVPRQIEAIAAAADGADPVPRLEWVVNASESLPASFVEQWDTVCERARVHNIYGMTESAIFAVWQEMSRGLAARSGKAPIGLPIPNITARVLNPALEPCPPGAPGEVYLGGIGIARGYLGRPGMTAERFVPDPLATAGQRLYRTGDVGCWLPGGEGLDYLGRSDFQVKVRGLRVEPGEVEVALRDHPAVRDAVIVGHEGRLVAYVVPASDERPALRAWLGERLPEHMIPAVQMWLDELPMTTHGKVDRRRLPEPLGARDLSAEPVAPRTAVEQILCDVWAAVLGIDHIGVHDDFFSLGGDSMLAIRLVGRVREAIPVAYTVGALFDGPTVAAAASYVGPLVRAAEDRLGDLLTEIEDAVAAGGTRDA